MDLPNEASCGAKSQQVHTTMISQGLRETAEMIGMKLSTRSCCQWAPEEKLKKIQSQRTLYQQRWWGANDAFPDSRRVGIAGMGQILQIGDIMKTTYKNSFRRIRLIRNYTVI